MTPQNEFIWMITQFDLAYQNTFSCRLLRMNDKAEVLEEVIMPYRMLAGSLAETENHYFVNNWQYPFIIKIDKDTLFKYDSININDNKNFPEGKMISVNNRLIHSLSGLEYYDCGEDWPDMFADRSILFLDDDLNTEKKLSLGVPCASNKGGVMKNMDYVNPDSIYYVYESIMDEDYSILRIANFSWDGTLNFDLTPDIPTNPSMPYRSVISCRALSNGGVLVCGEEKEYKIINSNESTRPFLLLYHPTMEVGIKEYTIKTSEIFPNPAQSQFTVTNTENATVCLYTVLGQKVKQVTDTEKNTIVQTENLPAGIYVVKVEKGNAVVTRKVQILK